ncbi:MAG: PorV/PorQ family protein [Gemmatimonadetes bacterium]|nr:PorV/PorQ family protein [Gemmatimonadota bacterium]
MAQRHLAAALGLLLAGSAPAAAQNLGQMLRPDPQTATTKVGTRGANFLEFGVGARAQALAGAVTALAEGATALYWNTAGSAGMEGIQAAFSYSELFDAGITHNYAAVVMPVGQGAVGASFINFSSGDIPRTTEEWPDGGDPVAGSTFEWTAVAFGLHYARTITDRLAVGAAAKYAQEGIEQGTASYLGLDLSTRFRTGLYGVTIGAALNNIGSSGRIEGHAVQRRLASSQAQDQFIVSHPIDITFRTRKAPLPTVFRFGVQTDLVGAPDALLAPNPQHRLVFAGEVTDAIDTDMQPAVGLEYSWKELFFLRGGKRWFNEDRSPWEFSDGMAGGFGLRVPVFGRKLAFDYSYTSMGELNNVQVFSLEFGF